MFFSGFYPRDVTTPQVTLKIIFEWNRHKKESKRHKTLAAPAFDAMDAGAAHHIVNIPAGELGGAAAAPVQAVAPALVGARWISVNYRGFGYELHGPRKWKQGTFTVVGLDIAKKMATIMQRRTRRKRNPSPLWRWALKNSLLKIQGEEAVARVWGEMPAPDQDAIVVIISGCAPPGRLSDENHSPTAKLLRHTIGLLTAERASSASAAGPRKRHVIVSAARHCGDRCRRVRKRPKKQGRCAKIDPEQRPAEGARSERLVRHPQFADAYIKYVSDEAVLTPPDAEGYRSIAAKYVDLPVVYVIMGIHAGAAFSRSLTDFIQTERRCAYVPHFSMAHVEKVATAIVQVLVALGLQVSVEDFWAFAKTCSVYKQMHTPESIAKQAAAHRANTDLKMLHDEVRVEFDDDTQECLACEVAGRKCTLARRQNWNPHCLATRHVQLLRLWPRDPSVFEVFDESRGRTRVRCLLCPRTRRAQFSTRLSAWEAHEETPQHLDLLADHRSRVAPTQQQLDRLRPRDPLIFEVFRNSLDVDCVRCMLCARNAHQHLFSTYVSQWEAHEKTPQHEEVLARHRLQMPAAAAAAPAAAAEP